MTAFIDQDEVPCRGEYTEAAREHRLDWLRLQSGAALRSLGEPGIEARTLRGNIENFVGTVEVPVGLAGPMLFTGDDARGLITAPLATTEGALVASVARGSRAITRSGGVTTRVVWQRMVRAPAFEFGDLAEAARFAEWVRGQLAALAEEVRSVSRHSTLIQLDPVQLGRIVHVRFVYETADAAGQNMTTVATWRACQWISGRLTEPGLPVPSWFTVEGNFSGDKKLSALNRLGGRGSRVLAECLIDHDTLRRVLKTTARSVDKTWRRAQQAAQFGGMALADVDAANVIAAMYLATGQDVASVHESSAAMFTTEVTDDGLLAGVVLPNLIVGTVGGGTRLAQQNDYLAAMGCAGEGGARRLAEIIGGFALALDLSTAAAIAAGHFADAHERLGRPHRVDWLRPDSLNRELVGSLLAETLERPELVVSGVALLGEGGTSSLLTDAVGAGERRKFTGVVPIRVEYTYPGAGTETAELIAKVKPLDSEVIIEVGKIASLCGGDVAEQYSRYREWTGFKHTHTRELALYRNADKALRQVMPDLWGLLEDPAREAYVLLLERLGADVILLNSLDAWQPHHVHAAIEGIAAVHAAWLGREDDLVTAGWLGEPQTAHRAALMGPLWTALVRHNADEFPKLLTENDTRRLLEIIDAVGSWWPDLAALPRTLVHGDFNPRNIALRAADLSLVAYDWELSTLHVPQRDLVELMAFVLTPDATVEETAELIERHRRAIGRNGADEWHEDDWRAGYRWALWDFATTRLQLYLMANSHQALPFLDRVVPTTMRLLALESETR
ncbi:phosphotransferase [Nocardia sp. NPDC051052]|uniref:phosphotransferase n=1 Tax=Nocardia sp. NPDC051052 TaxID=3364322 RepID=UPI0037AF0722